ncbi:MAG: glycosyltransferase family 39 protein [Planctomycetes bacterium]|nr:glycosyltransferase family 39 protein [Planctomycetota bacterium]
MKKIIGLTILTLAALTLDYLFRARDIFVRGDMTLALAFCWLWILFGLIQFGKKGDDFPASTETPAGKAFPYFWLILPAVVSACIALVVLKGMPNSGDEYSYAFQAELFSKGKLHANGTTIAPWIKMQHVITGEKIYSKYPPGWPCVLALGKALGSPWLVNPLLGVVALLGLYRLVELVAGKKAARYSLIMAATSPFFIFNAASYFSHIMLFAAVAWMWYFSISALEKGKRADAFLAGIAWGVALSVRPASAIIAAAPLLLYALRDLARGKLSPLTATCFLLSAIPLAGIMPGYNYLMQGTPWVSGYSIYDSKSIAPHLSAWQLLVPVSWLVLLCSWTPLGPFIAAGRIFGRGWFVDEKYRWERLGVIAFLLQAGSYGLLVDKAGDQYGPRYFLDASFVLFWLAGARLSAWAEEGTARKSGFVLKAVLALSLAAVLPFNIYRLHQQVEKRWSAVESIRKEVRGPSIVIIHDDEWGKGRTALQINNTEFDNEVLFLFDLGEANKKLFSLFPDRTIYRYVPEKNGGLGRLEKYPKP